ncbi:tetratricopeptide repeat protein [Anatilimnocola aggregata]|uniref:Tetratricopeptide repeat protein n=1 Tax=Anatilimnocola aggregata TaxID=2528021 RepID=A0A517YLA2_9BACT|nr:tetratricopeptide repeat protein [Anatilimnocola aggregata]QDU31002.1 tetratricopeptide repeat protein [Anatilimnocola aggregata]
MHRLRSALNFTFGRISPTGGEAGPLAIAQLGLLLTVSLATTMPTRAAGLNDAQNLLLKGRYEEARELFAAEQANDAVAAIGLARVAEETGDRKAAADQLAAAAKQFPQDAKVHGERARLALDQGDLKLAEEAARQAREIDDASAVARWVQAEILRLNGKLDEALQGYLKIVAVMNRLQTVKDPYELRIIGLAAARYARLSKSSAIYERLVNDLYPAALKLNENFWPAHFDSCQLFLEKYNVADATDQLQAGLAIHPQAAELHAAQAAILIDKFDLTRARAAVARALQARPDLLYAQQLAADICIADQRSAEAIPLLEKTLPLQSHSLETKGRLLACYAHVDGCDLERPSPRMIDLLKPVQEKSSCLGEVYFVAGDACDRTLHFPLAQHFYEAALKKLPQHIYIRGNLGLAHMRLGDEKQAALTLEESFRLDPYNVRVKNQLEVLDLLQSYAVIETPHFLIKFDRGASELLAKYAAEVLEEEIYPQITRALNYKPTEKTLIEIFTRGKNTSGHGWFSARMVGLPSIGTVGACAGKMVAIVSPDELNNRFSWARVLRHEFVHVVNLQQTDFRIPHWLTEGLAVHFENQPRPAEWNKLLVARSDAGKLFTLDDIRYGFIRPANKDDWTLAYCQSEIYVDYLLKRFGPAAPGKLLQAIAERQSLNESIQTACAVDLPEFEKGYSAHVRKVIDEIRGPVATHSLPLAVLLKKAAENDKDPAIAAALAQAYLERSDRSAARRWAKQAMELDPKQLAAAYVLARLAQLSGDDEAALELLRPSLEEVSTNADSLALLTDLLVAAGDHAAALKGYEQGRQAFPTDERWLKGLARIYLQKQENDKLLPILAELAARDGDNVTLRKKLAQLTLAAKDPEASRRWATEAVYLNVRDATAHALRAAAEAELKNQTIAEREFQTAIDLDGAQPEYRAGLARAQMAQKKLTAAKATLAELTKRHPDFSQLPELEQMLKEALP